MLVTQAYKFALDPTPRRQRALASHTGASRRAYNWGLHLVQARLAQRRAGQDVRVPWTLYDLRREWNQVKEQVAPWWRQNSKEAYASGLDALARALKNWVDSTNGRRKGKPMGFPCPKKKGRARETCRFTTGPIKVLPDRHHIQLPRIGVVRTHESTRKLARRLEQGTARILAATISRAADRWFVSFTVEVQRAERTPRRPEAVVGVDVGIRHLAVLSTGQAIPNPAPLQGALRRLRRLNRQLARRHGPRAPDGSRRAASASWRRARRQLARAQARVANVRRDHLHKLTTGLAGEYGTVVVEQLHVAGMLHNRSLARRLADAGMTELRRQLAYKTTWADGRLVQADMFYPSSKTCSDCGHVKAKLPLSAREFHCERCELAIDRDENAARNLAALVQTGAGMEVVAGSGPETQNARGADVSPGLAGRTALNREAGTGLRPDRTGTVGAQAPAAWIADER